MKLRMAILGTRGIPNHYGGFEQITEYLAPALAARGHDVTVYNSHNHPNEEKEWKGVHIVHCYDPEHMLKTAGQFIYDLNCIRHARRQHYDVIVFMGYSSSSVWKNFFPKGPVIISNMDGVEWKRTKYNWIVRQFLKHAERWAIEHSHFHIADSVGIRWHLLQHYGVETNYIPYGAGLERQDQRGCLETFGLQSNHYYMLMARMEKENNIDTILEGYSKAGSPKKFLVVGNMQNGYGRKVRKKYGTNEQIIFAGTLFDQDLVHTLRKNACLYFHGHSVGGTNPSLLEAMASGACIAAHDNIFNRSILGRDAAYFTNAEDVSRLLDAPMQSKEWKENNVSKIREHYNWEKVTDQYEDFLCHCYKKLHHEKTLYHKRHVYQ